MANQYQVKSFHLNIDDGDCAFHYRFKSKTNAKVCTVDRAVLVDGGREREVDRMIEFFEALERRKDVFKCPAGRTIRQMDAVIVSHWDGDHVDGLIQVFLLDLQQKLKAYQINTYPPGKNPPVSVPISAILQNDIDDAKIPDLQTDLSIYDANGYPVTQLWSPYWNVKDSQTNPKPQATPAASIKEWSLNATNKYIRLTVQHNWTDKNVNYAWKVQIPILRFDKAGRDLLGLDLFTGTQVMQPNAAKSPEDVSNALKGKPPAMFCVAADFGTCDEAGETFRGEMNWVTAKGNYTDLLLKHPTAPFANDKPLDLFRDAGLVDIKSINGSTSSNNQASIACMIIWPYAAGKRLASHYFAGDIGSRERANWAANASDVEERVLRWSTVPLANKKIREPINVDAMKFSHHGSKRSTPLNMFFAWKPECIIASNSMKSRYNHVSWENIYLVYAYTKWALKNYKYDDILYCTNFPVYLVNCVKVGGNKSFVGPGSISSLKDSDGRAWRQIWTELQKVIALDNLPDFNSGTLIQVKNLICNWIDTNWSQTSAVKKQAYSDSGNITDIQMLKSYKQDLRMVMVEQSRGISTVSGTLGTLVDLDGLDFAKTTTTVKQIRSNCQNQKSGQSTKVLRNRLEIKKAKQYTAKLPVNTRFKGNSWSENRLQRMTAPMCSEQAFNNLILDNDVYDDGDGGEGSNKLKVPERCDSDNLEVPDWDISEYDFADPTWVDNVTYLNASDATPKDPSTISVDPKTNADYFLGHLKTGSIVFASQPPSIAATVPLHGSDELYQWLMDILGDYNNSSHGLSVNASLAGRITKIGAISFTTQLRCAFDDRTKVPSADNKLLDKMVTFSTINSLSAFDEGIWSAPKASRADLDLFGPAQVACLGLGDLNLTDETVQVTGAGLIAMLGIQPSALLSALISGLKLTLNSSNGQRNALWFVPDSTYTTTLRLAFIANDGPAIVNSLIDVLGQLINNGQEIKDRVTVTDVQIIGKKTWQRRGTDGESDLLTSPEIAVLSQVTMKQDGTAKPVSMQTAVTFRGAVTQWFLTFNPKDNFSFSDVIATMGRLFGVKTDTNDFDLGKYLPALDSILLRRVVYTSKQQEEATARSLEIGVQITFAKMIFLCTIKIRFGDEESFSIDGSLFPENRPGPGRPIMTWHKYMPNYEPWTALEPVIKSPDSLLLADGTASDVGDLQEIYKSLMAAQSSKSHEGCLVPAVVATLPAAPVEFELVGLNFVINSKLVQFSALVGSQKPDERKYAVPPVRLLTAALKVDYNHSSKTLEELSLGTTALLTNPNSDERVLANLALAYSQPTWTLTGGLLGMSGSFIYTLFDSDCDKEMVELLKQVSLSFHVQYSYDTTGAGSEFDIQGLLHIGAFDFDFIYHHYGSSTAAQMIAEGDPKWYFRASLSSNTASNDSLVSIIDSLCGGGLSALLPECVQTIDVKPSPDNALTALNIVKTETALIFCIRLQLTDGTSICFYQLQETRKDIKNDPVKATKRVLMFSLDKLPEVPDIPVVGKLKQPFDEMRFFWVSSTDETSAGLTHTDVEEINKSLPKSFAPLVFKNTAKPPKGTPQDKRNLSSVSDSTPAVPGSDEQNTVALSSGFHFCILSSDKLVLDYAFKGKKKDETAFEDDPLVSGKPATAPINKAIGPVTITALGLKYDFTQQILSLTLDGTLKLGPLELSLIGFEVSFSLKGASLKDWKTFPKPDFALKGLALAFERKPITLAGGFGYGTTDGGYFYKGAAALGFDPWLFEGGGYYGVSQRSDAKPPPPIKGDERKYLEDAEEWAIIDPYLLEAIIQETKRRDIDIFDEGTFKSFFAFARFSGPIATIGYAEIRDVCGGFGYNTTIAFPTMQNILKFPFFKPPGSGGASAALTNFLDSGWVTNSEGTNWVAAGLTVYAFQMLSVTAIVVVQFGSSIKLGIFGLATAEIPKAVAGQDPPYKFAVVQLGVSATVDFDAGILKVDGQLTPASYILDPSCHLTGGFALYSWFGAQNQSLQGDWVFTIGGYHAAYRAPDQYPKPPRLGISWSYDDSINITGEAYFAITPKACMGGGSLKVTLSSGNLYAYFNAWADFLINYKPFQYQADGGVSVGVHYVMDLWVTTATISVDLGAQLSLRGPPMSGTVHIDFYVFGFDVDFGDQKALGTAQIAFGKFYSLVLQAAQKPTAIALYSDPLFGGDETRKSDVETKDTDPAVHIISCLNGLIPQTDKGSTTAGSKWLIHGAVFAFSVSSKFAIDTAKVVTASSGTSKDVDNPAGKGKVFANPMGLTSAMDVSELQLTISHDAPSVAESGDIRVRAMETDWNNNKAVTSALPTALWGKYDSSADPNGGNNHSPPLLDGTKAGTVPLMTGIQLQAPGGGPSDDKLAAYNVEKAMREVAYAGVFPAVDPGNSIWSPGGLNEPSKTRFAEVKQAWKDAGDKGNLGEAATFWASLPWNAATWDVKGMADVKVPEVMRSGLDRYYVEAPCVSVH